MKNEDKSRFSRGRIFLTAGMLASALAVSGPPSATADTFFCSSNTDYFTRRCTVHPNAISRVTDGVATKGHLVGGQYKSFSCINNVCRDNFGTAVIPFAFPMTDLAQFCSLLLKSPPCPGKWEK